MTTCPWTAEVAASLGMPFTCATLEMPTTYRVRFAEAPETLPQYRVICISELGADYGDKGTIIPMCGTHDATALLVETLIAPPAPLELALAGSGPGTWGAGSGGVPFGRGPVPDDWYVGFPPVLGSSDPPGLPRWPDAPLDLPPVSLPGAMVLLALAIVAFIRFRH